MLVLVWVRVCAAQLALRFLRIELPCLGRGLSALSDEETNEKGKEGKELPRCASERAFLPTYLRVGRSCQPPNLPTDPPRQSRDSSRLLRPGCSENRLLLWKHSWRPDQKRKESGKEEEHEAQNEKRKHPPASSTSRFLELLLLPSPWFFSHCVHCLFVVSRQALSLFPVKKSFSPQHAFFFRPFVALVPSLSFSYFLFLHRLLPHTSLALACVCAALANGTAAASSCLPPAAALIAVAIKSKKKKTKHSRLLSIQSSLNTTTSFAASDERGRKHTLDTRSNAVDCRRVHPPLQLAVLRPATSFFFFLKKRLSFFIHFLSFIPFPILCCFCTSLGLFSPLLFLSAKLCHLDRPTTWQPQHLTGVICQTQGTTWTPRAQVLAMARLAMGMAMGMAMQPQVRASQLQVRPVGSHWTLLPICSPSRTACPSRLHILMRRPSRP